jgi:flavin-dependent dehydrogenase
MEPTAMRDQFDVVVVGGGPAGSTVAALGAEKGHKVLLLERDEKPPLKVGESLMPDTYWSFKRLGLLDKLAQSDFPRKYSVQFFGSSGKGSVPFYFDEHNPHESAVTWQVKRDVFDQMMLDNAAEKGAEVVQGAAVHQVLFDGDRATGVQVRRPDGQTQEIGARVVVDATGQSTLIARRLGLKKTEANLRKASIFTHFRGGSRDEGRDEGATLILHTQDKAAWFWSIPLSDDVVSIGVVGDLPYLFEGRRQGQKGLDAQQVFMDELDKCPALKQRLQGAEQLSPVRTTKDFSYRADRVAGAGWVLVGDAYCFLDPMYSSGVFLALKSGELAADAIDAALKADDTSAARLGVFGDELAGGTEAIRKLVYAFYDNDFSFGRFLTAHPECRQGVVDILSGDVFKDSVHEIFAPMAQMCDLPLGETQV